MSLDGVVEGKKVQDMLETRVVGLVGMRLRRTGVSGRTRTPILKF